MQSDREKSRSRSDIHLGIDAINIRQGGGLTHLSQLLRAADPGAAGIAAITVWSNQRTAAALPDEPWLSKRNAPWMDSGLPTRILGQQFRIPRELRRAGCDALFSPGGTLPNACPVPAVTMSQNMLPFDAAETARFGRWDSMQLKMRLLRLGQGRSFQHADGLIFLTQYARTQITSELARVPDLVTTIPHGIESRFFCPPRPSRSLDHYGLENPFRILYVSILMPYKHQYEVAHAAAALRAEGFPLEMRFVGASWGEYGRHFRILIDSLDPERKFLLWSGEEPFESVHAYYRNSDLFVFASSCENLPNILIEAMAAGLPIAVSDRGPMPETLGDAGVYFDPERTDSIVDVLRSLMRDAPLRTSLAERGYNKAHTYSWTRCARETFEFIAHVARESTGKVRR